MSDAKAGQGNPNPPYISNPDGAAGSPYVPGKHYIGIDVAMWFVNDQGNFFKDHMVAGTIDITVNGKTYPVVLGQYQLKGGEKIAQIFDWPLITSMPYVSGDIGFSCVMQGTQQNTAAGALLNQIAAATFKAVATAVSLETLAVGGIALGDPVGILVKGAQQVLNDNSAKKVDIFSHFAKSISPTTELRGTQSYVLIHRGTAGLDSSLFHIPKAAEGDEFHNGTDVQYNGQPFRDGAWLLLRIRRSDTYTGNPRPWQDGDWSLNSLKQALNEVIDLWRSSQITVEDVKKNLQKSTNETPTIADQAAILRRRIRADQGLIFDDQMKYAAVVQAYLQAAVDAANANKPQAYADAVAAIEGTVKSNAAQPKVLTDAIVAEFTGASDGQSDFDASHAEELTFVGNVLS